MINLARELENAGVEVVRNCAVTLAQIQQQVPDRVKLVEKMMPGEGLNVFQKAFKWALAKPEIHGVVAGIENMEMAKEDVPLAVTGA